MRIDIAQTVKVSVIKDIKPNYSKIAKQLNCDSKTVKCYYLNKITNSRKPLRKTRVYKSILEPYLDIVKDKLTQSIRNS